MKPYSFETCWLMLVGFLINLKDRKSEKEERDGRGQDNPNTRFFIHLKILLSF